MKRLSELDLLRFVAALSVVLYHRLWTDPAFPSWLTNVTQMGYLGVHLFFMISGFVILMTAMGRTSWQFLASRISRLYPAFWAGLAITSLLIWLIRDGVPWSQFLANATMFPTVFKQEDVDPLYWTLVTEWKFYALILALIALQQMKRIEFWLWAWLAVNAIAVFLPPHFVLKQATLAGYAPLFILGCSTYLIRTKPRPSRMALFVGATILSVWHAYADIPDVPFSHQITAALSVAVIAVVFLLVVLQKVTLRQSRVWYWLGALTYPVYLLHYTAMNVLGGVLPWSVPAKQAFLIAVAFAAALLVVVTVERKVSPAFHRALLRRPGKSPAPATTGSVRES